MHDIPALLFAAALLCALLVPPSGALRAQPAAPAPAPSPPAAAKIQDEKLQREAADPAKDGLARPLLDDVWNWRRIYDNPANPVIQRFDVRGRLQADYALMDADQGSYSDTQFRRFRIGFESHWAADLRLHVEVDLDLNSDDPYEGLTEASIAWRPSQAFELKVGKHSAPFTLDGTTSSTRLITLERNNVTNNLWFPEEYHAGVAVAGRKDPWRYRLGVFSSSTTEEFGSFDGGYFGLLSLSYDIPHCSESAECWLKLDYVYNDPNENNVGTRDLEHVGSLQFRYDQGRFGKGRLGVRVDLSGGIGYFDQPDLLGVALVPFFHITPTLRVVGRYTFVKSFGENGVRLKRYESRVVSGRGDRYHEAFLGLTWLLYGHRLKLQTGLTYARMYDRAGDGGEYQGIGWTSGIRISW